MPEAKTLEAQVAIVGAGPVGILLAILLGKKGHSVIIADRWPDVYDLPRAVTMDAEVARILATLGIDCDNDEAFENHRELYYWKNADLKDLQIVDWKSLGPSGWYATYWFNQPQLEARLMSILTKLKNVKVMRGWEALKIFNGPNNVKLDLQQTPELFGRNGEKIKIKAKYLVGADGANSHVRDALGVSMVDKGYFFDWLILDIIPGKDYQMHPAQWQLCDPNRPTTLVPGGPGRRRWEFMVLPEEDAKEIAKPESAWRLLQPWDLCPDNATLERSAIYRFKASWANKWRVGRCLLAGDSAHLMPPFAGAGMCAGLRDSVALGWRLDTILVGKTTEKLLDSYESERKPHAKKYIDFSQQLGEIICIIDSEKAVERDKKMISELVARGYEPIIGGRFKLGSGIWCEDKAGTGEISAQGIVEYLGKRDRFDQAVGQGWFVIAVNRCTLNLLGPGQLAILESLDGKLLSIGPAKFSYDVVDICGFYSDWSEEIDACYLIIRPDFYVAASAKTPAELSHCFDRVMNMLNLESKTKVQCRLSD